MFKWLRSIHSRGAGTLGSGMATEPPQNEAHRRNFTPLDAVRSIIDFLEAQAMMTHEERIKATAGYRISEICDIVCDHNDISARSAAEVRSTLSPNRSKITAVIEEVRGDINALSDIVAAECADYFLSAMPPTPRAARELADALVASDHKELEIEFLTVWSEHFHTCPGPAFQKLYIRAH